MINSLFIPDKSFFFLTLPIARSLSKNKEKVVSNQLEQSAQRVAYFVSYWSPLNILLYETVYSYSYVQVKDSSFFLPIFLGDTSLLKKKKSIKIARWFQTNYQSYITAWYYTLTLYRIRLRLVGSGFFFAQENVGANLAFIKIHAGWSHVYILPFSQDDTHFFTIKVNVAGRKKKILVLVGRSRHHLQTIAHSVKNLRWPDAYQGKGIRLLHEKVLLKTGKKKFV